MSIARKAKVLKAEPLKRLVPQPYMSMVTLGYPDHKSKFIAQLSELISEWRGIPGKEAAAYATAYENVLYSLLAPEQE